MVSGLPEEIDNAEDIARFLTQSSHFSSIGVKNSAFLPCPRSSETSVSRHGKEPLSRLMQLGELAAGSRNLYGAALLKAKDIRDASLLILADEPPAFHAVIRGWPEDRDPALQKAKQKETALVLASKSETFLF